MEVLKFTISGQGASFTRPSFNSMISSYSHIHKISILGILGSIIGIEKDKEKKGVPTFYKELNSLKIAIVPKSTKFFSKKDTITDTTNFNNKGTYVAHYEILLNPSWDVYIMANDNKHYDKIKNNLINGDYIYIPYLFRNHWFCNFSNVEILEGVVADDVEQIDSLFIKSDVETEESEDFMTERIYFKEYMPIGFKEEICLYQEEELVLTNDIVIDSKMDLFNVDDRVLYFI